MDVQGLVQTAVLDLAKQIVSLIVEIIVKAPVLSIVKEPVKAYVVITVKAATENR